MLYDNKKQYKKHLIIFQILLEDSYFNEVREDVKYHHLSTYLDIIYYFIFCKQRINLIINLVIIKLIRCFYYYFIYSYFNFVL